MSSSAPSSLSAAWGSLQIVSGGHMPSEHRQYFGSIFTVENPSFRAAFKLTPVRRKR